MPARTNGRTDGRTDGIVVWLHSLICADAVESILFVVVVGRPGRNLLVHAIYTVCCWALPFRRICNFFLSFFLCVWRDVFVCIYADNTGSKVRRALARCQGVCTYVRLGTLCWALHSRTPLHSTLLFSTSLHCTPLHCVCVFYFYLQRRLAKKETKIKWLL